MPTDKFRLSVTLDESARVALEELAKLRGVPLATMGQSLLERALELDEDAHFSRVADERIANRERRISHARAWK